MLKLKTPPFIYEDSYCFVLDDRYRVYKIYTDVPGSWLRETTFSDEKFERIKSLGSELTSIDVLNLMKTLELMPRSAGLPDIKEYVNHHYLT